MTLLATSLIQLSLPPANPAPFTSHSYPTLMSEISGIKYLFSNLKKSFPLILFIIVEFTIKIAAYQTVYNLNAPQENVLIVMSIGYICNILTLCIALMVFSIASMNILDQSAYTSIEIE